MSSEAIKAVLSQWGDAFSQPTTDEICALYTKDSVLLATLSPVYRNTPALIKAYFDDILRFKKHAVTFSEINVQDLGDSAICSGFYTFHLNSTDEKQHLDARFTFVLAKEEGHWLIAHHHSSDLPET